MAEERRQMLALKKQQLAQMKLRNRQHQPISVPNGDDPPTNTSQMMDILAKVGIENAPPPEIQNDVGVNGVNGTHSSPAISHSRRRNVELEISVQDAVSIAPKVATSYSKTTQTDDERTSVGEFSLGSQEFYDDEFSKDVDINFDESPTHELAKLLPHLRVTEKGLQDANEEPEPERIPDLSEDEKRQILISDGFQTFFSKASKVLLRELAERADTDVDYAYDFSLDQQANTGELLTLNRRFFEDDIAGRNIQGMSYSAYHPELIAVAYDNRRNDVSSHPGIVHVWNTKFKLPHPEYTFTSSARISSIEYARFHSNIIIGGLFTGQMCIWDNRVNKRTPVQKSQLSSKGHTQPICSMSIVGSQNANSLVSLSTDGKLCSWTLDNLLVPSDSQLVSYKQRKGLSVCSMSFLQNHISSFVVGGVDGDLYVGDRHAANGEMVKNLDLHRSPISTVDCHRATAVNNDFTQLCVTGSSDSTLKLVNLEDASCLLAFEHHYDYVTDVKWSPVHPAVFASLDNLGVLNLWNLNVDSESPVSSLDISNGEVGVGGAKLQWNASGQQLIVGNMKGEIFVFDTHESLHNVRNDEWEKLTSTLREIKASSNELNVQRQDISS